MLKKTWAGFALVVISLGLLALPAIGAPPGPIGAAGHIEGVVGFVDQNHTRQQFTLNIDAAGPDTYSVTGSLKWVTGAHPGVYTDLVKWTVDTTTPDLTAAYGLIFMVDGAEWGLQVKYWDDGSVTGWVRALGGAPGTQLVGPITGNTLHS